MELELWRAVKDSNEAAVLQTYLAPYPQGTFSGLAKVMIERGKRSGADASAPGAGQREGPGQELVKSATAPPRLPETREVTLRATLGQVTGRQSGTLGVTIKDLTEDDADLLGLSRQSRVLVTRMAAGGPAAAGVQSGDVVLKLNGSDMRNSRRLAAQVSSRPRETEVELLVWRSNRFTDVLTYLRGQADSGNGVAAKLLGTIHERDIGIAADSAAALNWCGKAAALGNTAAMNRLGALAKDPAEKERWFKAAAANGATTASENLDALSKDNSAREARKDAERGDAGAMYDLAKRYESGEGVPKDDAEALRWYRKVAAAGLVSAMYRVGVAYDSGTGAKEDDAEAVVWYRKARTIVK